MRLLRARGSAELKKVASGSATQGLWQRNRKVESQVSGINRSRFPGRKTVREVRRGGTRGRRASDRAKKRVYRFRVRFGDREGQVVCHTSAVAFAMTDEARREVEL